MKRVLGLIVSAVIVSLPTGALAEKTFYIEESTDFSGNGCENGDLNAVTASLQTKLVSLGWTGQRWVNADAWPQDFIESCSSSFGSGGDDASWADSRLLTVYAGHGNKGRLQWGYSHNGRCSITFQPNMRLGSMAGARSGLGMYLTSCTLSVDSLVAQANWQWLHQQLGFQNSPGIANDSPSLFVEFTDFFPNNKESWLNVMEDDSPIFDLGGDSPVVVSYDSTESRCWSRHDTANIKASSPGFQRSFGPSCQAGQPAFFYCYTLVNNGGCP